METTNPLTSPGNFSKILYHRMCQLNTGVQKLQLYEFRYALENMVPQNGWESIALEKTEEIERLVQRRDFFESVQVDQRENGKIILDNNIVLLTQMLFIGLVLDQYSLAWVTSLFYFDIRGFYFLPRTVYFSREVSAHFGGGPHRVFEQGQKRFESFQELGYTDFKEANVEIDNAFMECIQKLILAQGTPMLITLAGPTASGKTEITERLIGLCTAMGKKVNTIEMDNFLLDRELREDKPMGKETTHFDLFQKSLGQLLQGRMVSIPRYDFINCTSSHAPDGTLRPGGMPLEIEPADIIFLEGNFPFQMEELSRLINIKVVYLTDDPIRLKRKWRRDVDYRKKYDISYFRNRFFKTQFMRAQDIYRPMMANCEIIVDTTGAALWLTPEVISTLAK